MNFVQFATTYITANILIVIGFALVSLVTMGSSLFRRRLIYRVELHLHYFIIALVFILVLAHPFLPQPENELFSPVAKVWAGPANGNYANEYSSSSHQGYVSLSSSTPEMLPISTASRIVTILFPLVILAGFFKFILDLRHLFRLRSRSFLVRKIDGFRIYVSEEILVPFSFWIPGQKNVVMPEALLGSAEWRIAVLHEIHHHRQGDTKWVYLLWLLRVVFFINPIIHVWNKWVSEIQEFACDEALLGQQKVKAQAYARCLVRVAESALHKERQPVCATGFAFLVDRKTLKRRIETMFEKQNVRLGWKTALTLGLCIALVLCGTAYASQSFVQDRRISRAQAEIMAKSAMREGGFPVTVNPQVLKWLNYYVGTPDGRRKMKEALVRMENYRVLIEGKLTHYELPYELLAIPLIESRYQNLEARENPIGAAGLWQFIARTAINFGLRVDEDKDERLNVDLSSDAALRLLLANKLRFNDWHLSVLAYNGGENAVQAAISKTASRDAWVLTQSGYLSRENREYLPKLIAAILVIQNPSSLQ